MGLYIVYKFNLTHKGFVIAILGFTLGSTLWYTAFKLLIFSGLKNDAKKNFKQKAYDGPVTIRLLNDSVNIETQNSNLSLVFSKFTGICEIKDCLILLVKEISFISIPKSAFQDLEQYNIFVSEIKKKISR